MDSKPSLNNPASQAPLAYLLVQTKKILSCLLQKSKPSAFFADPEKLANTAKEFQRALFLLQCKDVSHQAPYLEQITQTWQELKKEGIPVRVKALTPPAAAENLKDLILAIETFPEGEDHSLGYYLARYNEANWSPFPFMQLLERLRQEHIDNPQKSTLQSWISLLEEIQADLSL